MQGILIALIGNRGIGVTTFAAAVAAETYRSAKKGVFNTILISNDRAAPALDLWLLAENNASDLGKLMEQSSLSVDDLFSAVSTTGKGDLDGLALLGIERGAQLHSHSQPDEDTVRRTLLGLKRFQNGRVSIGAVIVDGTDESDPFTSVALREADLVISLIHADRKGVAFVQAHKALYTQLETENVEQLVFPVQRNTFDPAGAVSSELGKWKPALPVQVPIPVCDEAHRKLVDGRLFDRYDDMRYRAAVNTAAKTILRVANYAV